MRKDTPNIFNTKIELRNNKLSSKPRSLAVRQFGKCIDADINIVNDLKIKHTDTDKISAIFKSPFEAVFRMNSARCQHFKTDDRHFCVIDKFYGTVRKRTETVVMEHIMFKV